MKVACTALAYRTTDELCLPRMKTKIRAIRKWFRIQKLTLNETEIHQNNKALDSDI